MNLFVGLLVIAVAAWYRACGDEHDGLFFAGLTLLGVAWMLLVS